MKTEAFQITVNTGKAHGRGPGHNYHDLQVTIGRKHNGRWSVNIIESWGTDSGFDEEQAQKHVTGRDATLELALDRATRLAVAASIDQSFLEKSLNQAVNQAKETTQAQQ